MDLSSQRQYIQRAESAHELLTTTDLTTLYTSPSGDDFSFSIVESILVCDHSNQNTDLTVTATHDATTYTLFKEFTINAYNTEDGARVRQRRRAAQGTHDENTTGEKIRQ